MKKWIWIVMALWVGLSLSGCYKMDSLPEGEFLSAHNSPDERYTVNVYLCGGNATTDYSIRGELVDQSTGAVENIYWSYHEQEASVEWVDNDTVSINGRDLDVPGETYDWRKTFP